MDIDGSLIQAIDAQYQLKRWNDFAGFETWLGRFVKTTGIPEAGFAELLRRFYNPVPRPAPEWQDSETVAILRDPPDTGPLASLANRGWISEDLAGSLRLSDVELAQYVLRDVDAARDVQENALHVLGRCNNPRDWGPTNRRGLVYGMVQSGKTANMIALIHLAKKVGYRLVILLAGDKDSLRNQTQYRMDLAFRLRNGLNQADLVSSPTFSGDFLQTTNSYEANFEYHGRVARKQPWLTIIVIKKQRHNLEKLIREILAMKEGLEREGLTLAEVFPTLILDDEADYATPDTDPEGAGSAIHRVILSLRAAIPRNCYVGYTATPQACLSANPNDEVGYPRDFFWLLEPYQVKTEGELSPKTYLGAYELFWEYERALIRAIGKDDWPHHEKDERGRPLGVYVPDRPVGSDDEEAVRARLIQEEAQFLDRLDREGRSLPSLTDALLDFMIGCGVRWWRDAGRSGRPVPATGKEIDDSPEFSHHAAMVHLSYNQDNQAAIRSLVRRQWKGAVRILREAGDAAATPTGVLGERWRAFSARLESLYPAAEVPTWDRVRPFVDLCVQITERPIHNHREPGFPLYPGSPFIYLLNSSDDGMELNYNPDEAFQIRTKKAAIIVGGNILSRGLTIQGLSVSVFGRSARIPLGDATLQMGRWLGHKKGELDYIQLYLQDEVKELLQQVALADDYLRRQIKDVIRHGFGPMEVLVELRNSPFFRATSPQKSRFLENDGGGVGFAGRSTWLCGPSFVLDDVRENTRVIAEFEQTQGPAVLSCNRARLYRNVDVARVTRLLESLRCQPGAPQATFMQYASYLKSWRAEEGRLPRVPPINIAVYASVQQRQRKLGSTHPASAAQARAEARDWFPSIIGGKGSLAGQKGGYLGDAFLDKSEDWQLGHPDASSDRVPGDDILIVLYPLHPTYLTRSLYPGSGGTANPQYVYAEAGNQWYVGVPGEPPERYPLWSFAAWTPSGGPLYGVGVNRLIPVESVRMQGRVVSNGKRRDERQAG